MMVEILAAALLVGGIVYLAIGAIFAFHLTSQYKHYFADLYSWEGSLAAAAVFVTIMTSWPGLVWDLRKR